MLAGWQSLMTPQMIADILSAALVANVHLVTASSAPGDAVQQKFAVSRCSSRLRAHVFGSVVSDNTPDLFKGRPIDVSRISILHDEPPFLHWPRGFCRRYALTRNLAHPGSAIDECAGIGGILQDRRHCRYGRSHPAWLAVPVTARQVEAPIIQHTHDLGYC